MVFLFNTVVQTHTQTHSYILETVKISKTHNERNGLVEFNTNKT